MKRNDSILIAGGFMAVYLICMSFSTYLVKEKFTEEYQDLQR